MSVIDITIEGGLYALRSPKDPILIDALKNYIPKQWRAWNGPAKAWLIDPRAVEHCKRAIEAAGYQLPQFPPMTSHAVAATTRRTFDIEYIGMCKERDGGKVSALATTNAQRPGTDRETGRPFYQWPVEFPEDVLKAFFEGKPTKTGQGQTLYQVLCVLENATADQLKSAYRRLSRQWHPDVCKEDNAAEKFRELTDAYTVLSEPTKRKRYDVGLTFEREAALKAADEKAALDEPRYYWDRRGHVREYKNYFRSPLRCGRIVCEGVQGMSRFTVTKIIAWDDIAHESGMILTASWNKESQSIEVRWI